MKEKQQKPNWYIAATHYLTAVIISGFLGKILFKSVILPLVVGLPIAMILFLTILFSCLVIWLGTMFSARYLTETYIIKDKKSVIGSAMICLVVLSIGGTAILQFSAGEKINTLDSVYALLELIPVAALFYFSSQKYIKEDIIPQ